MKRENFERAKALIGRAKDVEDLIKSIRENGVLFFRDCSAVNPDCHV